MSNEFDITLQVGLSREGVASTFARVVVDAFIRRDAKQDMTSLPVTYTLKMHFAQYEKHLVHGECSR